MSSTSHGRDTVWELRAREAPEHLKANWPGSAKIVEVISATLTRKGTPSVRRHLKRFNKRPCQCATSVRTTP